MKTHEGTLLVMADQRFWPVILADLRQRVNPRTAQDGAGQDHYEHIAQNFVDTIKTGDRQSMLTVIHSRRGRISHVYEFPRLLFRDTGPAGKPVPAARVVGHPLSLCVRGAVRRPKIREKRGDYVLAVKKNQGPLLEEIQEAWELNELEGCDRLRVGYFETVEEGHGRVEIRRIWQSSQMSWVPSGKSWKGAKSFPKVESERHVDGKITKEIRYFVSSLGLDPERLLRVVRSHWMVENPLHWVLDVTFKEDASRIRRGDAPENL